MALAVVCPTRGRPARFRHMAESVLATSPATVLGYVDDDDPSLEEARSIEGERVRVVVGGSIGRGQAINHLCALEPRHRMYLLVSDDTVFTSAGWYEKVVSAMDSFGDDIGLVHLAGSDTTQGIGDPWVNWPCVSAKWVDALGWFNYPECRWYCQDTILQALAEAIQRIKRIDDIHIHHWNDTHPAIRENLNLDTEQFLWFFAQHFGDCLGKLRKAMA